MRINNNIAALQTYTNLLKTNRKIDKSVLRLSSGVKINSVSDDAAGMSVSNKLKNQINGMEMAGRNSLDGISLVQTAEGALGEIHSMLRRIREMAVQAANDTLEPEDRKKIQMEIDQLIEEIDETSYKTEFNTIKLLNGDAEKEVFVNRDLEEAAQLAAAIARAAKNDADTAKDAATQAADAAVMATDTANDLAAYAASLLVDADTLATDASTTMWPNDVYDDTTTPNLMGDPSFTINENITMQDLFDILTDIGEVGSITISSTGDGEAVYNEIMASQDPGMDEIKKWIEAQEKAIVAYEEYNTTQVAADDAQTAAVAAATAAAIAQAAADDAQIIAADAQAIADAAQEKVDATANEFKGLNIQVGANKNMTLNISIPNIRKVMDEIARTTTVKSVKEIQNALDKNKALVEEANAVAWPSNVYYEQGDPIAMPTTTFTVDENTIQGDLYKFLKNIAEVEEFDENGIPFDPPKFIDVSAEYGSDVYKNIMDSTNPSLKDFQDWIIAQENAITAHGLIKGANGTNWPQNIYSDMTGTTIKTNSNFTVYENTTINDLYDFLEDIKTIEKFDEDGNSLGLITLLETEGDQIYQEIMSSTDPNLKDLQNWINAQEKAMNSTGFIADANAVTWPDNVYEFPAPEKINPPITFSMDSYTHKSDLFDFLETIGNIEKLDENGKPLDPSEFINISEEDGVTIYLTIMNSDDPSFKDIKEWLIAQEKAIVSNESNDTVEALAMDLNGDYVLQPIEYYYMTKEEMQDEIQKNLSRLNLANDAGAALGLGSTLEDINGLSMTVPYITDSITIDEIEEVLSKIATINGIDLSTYLQNVAGDSLREQIKNSSNPDLEGIKDWITAAEDIAVNYGTYYEKVGKYDRNNSGAISDDEYEYYKYDNMVRASRNVSVETIEDAKRTIIFADEAIAFISEVRADLGAYQNRLEYTESNLRNTGINTQEALSRIRDTDMALEMSYNVQNGIISQAGIAILGQANQRPQQIIQLLQ